MAPFLMGTTSSINMQRLGKIVQRAPAVGAKMWCLFVFLPAGCREAANCRYQIYSQAKNQVFRPAGATRCTDSGQTLQDRRAPGSAWPCKISHQSAQGVGMRPQNIKKFPLFGKESPRRGDSLDRLTKFLGSFICPTILRQCFKFHVIRFTGYRVIAEKPHVGQLGRIILCTCRKNYALDQKMNGTFFDGHDEHYHRAKFGGRSHNVRRLQERKCGVFCLFVMLRVRSTVCSRGAQFEQALHCRLLPDFDAVFSVFSQGNHSFRDTTQFAYLSLGGSTIFAKLQSKIVKSPKIGGKVCVHHFIQIADRFKENFTAVVQGGKCRCAPIEIFFRMTLPSADSKC